MRFSEPAALLSCTRTSSAAFSSCRRRPTRPRPCLTSTTRPLRLSSVWRSDFESSAPFLDSDVISPRNPSPFSVRPRMFLSDFEIATTLSTRSPEPARILSSSAPRKAMISWSGSRSGLSGEPGVTSRYLSPRRPIVLISARLSVFTRCWYLRSMSKWTVRSWPGARGTSMSRTAPTTTPASRTWFPGRRPWEFGKRAKYDVRRTKNPFVPPMKRSAPARRMKDAKRMTPTRVFVRTSALTIRRVAPCASCQRRPGGQEFPQLGDVGAPSLPTACP